MIEIQYLESTENLKKNIHASQGWMPNAGQADAIAACLRQGRLFYEAAKRAPMEIKPLELYYGTAAYAKAIVLSTNRHLSLNALQQSHGVRDKSTHNARLAELSVAINQRGTFQEFNDCVRALNRIQPLSMDGSRQVFNYACTDSASIVGATLSLKDIFSRLPGLESLYLATFDERANIDYVHVIGPEEGFTWTVQVSAAPWGMEFDRFLSSIRECRNRIPFLQRWSFLQASSSLSGATLSFRNAEPLDNELAPNSVRQTTWGFEGEHPPFARYFRNIEASIGPLIAIPGKFGGGCYVQPMGGQFFALQSLQFLALHLLSSLVRYRPATWMHALSRSANNGRAADDAMLALIDAFMENVQSTTPVFVAEIIRPGLSV